MGLERLRRRRVQRLHSKTAQQFIMLWLTIAFRSMTLNQVRFRRLLDHLRLWFIVCIQASCIQFLFFFDDSWSMGIRCIQYHSFREGVGRHFQLNSCSRDGHD